MVAPQNVALEQDGVQQDPLEIAASYSGYQIADWRLVDSHNGFSVFMVIPRQPRWAQRAVLLLCYDHASLERECVVVSPDGAELMRVVGKRVRCLNCDFGFTPTLGSKIDRFIDQTLVSVDQAIARTL